MILKYIVKLYKSQLDIVKNKTLKEIITIIR